MTKSFFLLGLIAAAAFAGPAQAKSLPDAPLPAPSLFFAPDEARAIEGLQKDLPLATAERCADLITLDSLLFFGTENWTLWLNGQRLSAQSPSRSLRLGTFSIQSISSAGVTLRADGGVGPIFLAPHETYDRTAGRKIDAAKVPLPCRKAQR